jgi:hypothetical protein
MTGLEFESEFPQPPELIHKSIEERESWWQASERLQSDTLVCLVIHPHTALFCTVADRNESKERHNTTGQSEAETSCLWKSADHGSVALRLVDTKSRDVQAILDLYSRGTHLSLVEFPGVLLSRTFELSDLRVFVLLDASNKTLTRCFACLTPRPRPRFNTTGCETCSSVAVVRSSCYRDDNDKSCSTIQYASRASVQNCLVSRGW